MSLSKNEQPSDAMEELHRLGCQKTSFCSITTESTFSTAKDRKTAQKKETERKRNDIGFPLVHRRSLWCRPKCLETWTGVIADPGGFVAEGDAEAGHRNELRLSCLVRGHQGLPRRF